MPSHDKSNKKNTPTPPSAKKAVTASLIMTVIALSLCFGILLGGIDSDADISDIFTPDSNEPTAATEGTIPVSYGNGELTAIFDTSDENRIRLNYYNKDDQNEREILFMFDNNNNLLSISERMHNTEAKQTKIHPEQNEDSTMPEPNDTVPISIFDYKDTRLSDETDYIDSKIAGYKKITSAPQRDQSVEVQIKFFDKDGELLKTEEFSNDKFGNQTSYSCYDSDGTQVSSVTRSYVYDSYGNITSCSFTNSSSDSIECMYRYDERGNIIYSAVYKNDLATVVTTYSYVYDDQSRVSEYTQSTIYSASGQSTVKTVKYTYDSGRMTARTEFDQANNILFSGSYDYSPDGALLRSTETDNTKGQTQTMGYEYMTGQLYQRMQTILSRWDVYSSTIKERIYQ